MRKHLAASTHEVTTHVDKKIDALGRKIGPLKSELDSMREGVRSEVQALEAKLDAKLDEVLSVAGAAAANNR